MVKQPVIGTGIFLHYCLQVGRWAILGMVDMTLKDGVEKTLLESLPQLKGVRDVTDHSVKENAYF